MSIEKGKVILNTHKHVSNVFQSFIVCSETVTSQTQNTSAMDKITVEGRSNWEYSKRNTILSWHWDYISYHSKLLIRFVLLRICFVIKKILLTKKGCDKRKSQWYWLQIGRYPLGQYTQKRQISVDDNRSRHREKSTDSKENLWKINVISPRQWN